MVGVDRAGEPALARRIVTAGAEADGRWERARACQADGRYRECECRPRQPRRGEAARDLDDDARQRRQHRERDEAIHRPGAGGHAGVVGGDRRQHRLRQICAVVVTTHLHVVHEVEPQHGEQEPDPGRHERFHARSVTQPDFVWTSRPLELRVDIEDKDALWRALDER